MFNKNDYKEVFSTLNLNIDSAVSIYKYAPVFKINMGDQHFVLKKTKKDPEKGMKLIQFQNVLNRTQKNVVEPIRINNKLHHKVNDDTWVVYPFVDGNTYDGSSKQIEMAGELLGRIHAASNNTFNHGFEWRKFENDFFEEVGEDCETIKNKYGTVPNLSRIQSFVLDDQFKKIRNVEVPYVDGIWDYKASNLIYSTDVILIDSDNSGYVPRVIDLALALLLFNTESPKAPDRPFTEAEWHVFMKGYNRFVTLEAIEGELFCDFLEFTFVDEAIWAIVDLDDDEPKRQQDFIKNLLNFNYTNYTV